MVLCRTDSTHTHTRTHTQTHTHTHIGDEVLPDTPLLVYGQSVHGRRHLLLAELVKQPTRTHVHTQTPQSTCTHRRIHGHTHRHRVRAKRQASPAHRRSGGGRRRPPTRLVVVGAVDSKHTEPFTHTPMYTHTPHPRVGRVEPRLHHLPQRLVRVDEEPSHRLVGRHLHWAVLRRRVDQPACALHTHTQQESQSSLLKHVMHWS
jgi:hypothetical protein